MTFSLRALALFICVLLSVLHLGRAGNAQEGPKTSAKRTDPLCTMQIALANGHIKFGETITVSVTVTNVSGKGLPIPAGPIDLHSRPFRLDVSDTSGALAPKRDEKPVAQNGLVLPEDMPSIGGRTYLFKAGESSTYTVNLTDLYAITKPGAYYVTGHAFKKEGRDWISSNRLSFVVE